MPSVLLCCDMDQVKEKNLSSDQINTALEILNHSYLKVLHWHLLIYIQQIYGGLAVHLCYFLFSSYGFFFLVYLTS